MRYRLPFHANGSRHILAGHKAVRNDRTVDLWTDTTTLFATLEQDGDGQPTEIARGILHIRPIDLVPQVLSMRAVQPHKPWDHGTALARFGLFFAAELWREYGPSLRRRRRAAKA
jgi:cholesterol oxidase